MSAEEYLRTEDMPGALAALEVEVRRHPDVARFRVFLFQLLCVLGQWQRALRQLQVAVELDPEARTMAQTYREAILCEVFREKVFRGETLPMIFGEPAEWIALLSESLKVLAAGDAGAAADLRAKAFDAAPATPGSLNGTEFSWIADADMRLGPLLEAVVNGRYYWVPFSAISELSISEPEDLRDVVWMPATLQLHNSGEAVALVPTRYAGTLETGEAAHQLARATSWTDLGGEYYAGIGQRILATDAGETALMDVRSLKLAGG